MSVDIVGSTAMKQGLPLSTDDAQEPDRKWFQLFATFYRQIEVQFAKHWSDGVQKASSVPNISVSGQPELWKANGDEVIYTKLLTSEYETVVCVFAWLKAVQDFRTYLRKPFPDLDLKCTLWLAGFPVANTEVVLRASIGAEAAETDSGDPVVENGNLLDQIYSNEREIPANQIIDFVGPHIDLGFRLGGLATPRKCIISIELAHLLLGCNLPIDSPFRFPSVRYDGRVELKGIMKGAPYPVFWLDIGHEQRLLEVEDEILGTPKHNRDSMREFCHKFMEQNPKYFVAPFIVFGDDLVFGEIPSGYLDHAEKFAEEWRLANEKFGLERKPDDGILKTTKTDQELESITDTVAKIITGDRYPK